MEAFWDYMARYPVLHLVLLVLFVLLFLFLLKKFFKMAILTVLVILMTLMGYYFFTSSGKIDEKMKSAYEKTKEQTSRVVGTGKEFIKKETESISRDTGKMVDKYTAGASDRKKDIEDLDKTEKPRVSDRADKNGKSLKKKQAEEEEYEIVERDEENKRKKK